MVRAQTSIPIVAAIALVASCAKEEAKEEAPEPGPPSVTRPADAAAARDPIDAASAAEPNRIKITVSKRPPPGSGFAKRCALGGDPVASDCVGGGSGIAFDRAGAMYLVAGQTVRRFVRAAGDDCKLEPTGDPIALPAENKRMQPLGKGPVYMRSGGPAWHLAHGLGDALLAVDFLGGVFRIDRGKSEPVCVDQFGYESIAAAGGKLYTARRGIERLTPGAQCMAAPAGLDPKAHGNVFAVRDKLYLAGRGSSGITRYDGTTAVVLAEGTRLCSVVALVACGAGACILDSNCTQLIQLGTDGKVLRTIDSDKLFDDRPYTLESAATAPSGDVFALARHKSGDTCETAVYRLPAALFAL